MEKQRVLEIIRMTNHNGPGFRTLVLFKGCPQKCIWCSTPESQKTEAEIGIMRSKCSLCGTCISVCPKGALSIAGDQLRIDREKCVACGKCAQACAWKAIRHYGGQLMSARQIAEQVGRDHYLFKNSGGGITVSGGEPLMLPTEFNLELFQRCHDLGFTAGVQTCGVVSWKQIEPLLDEIDFFLWDIKLMDPERHRKCTGLSNSLGLENCRKAAEYGVPIYVRVPVIPGFTDDDENIRAIGQFCTNLPSLQRVDLLPMHHLGKARYEALDRTYEIDELPYIEKERMNELAAIVQDCGVTCGIIG